MRAKKNFTTYEDAREQLNEKFDDFGAQTSPLRVDMVGQPPHYTHGSYETIEIIEDWELNFHCGNALKYISRHKHKGNPTEDIKKAIWYLQRYLTTLEGE